MAENSERNAEEVRYQAIRDIVQRNIVSMAENIHGNSPARWEHAVDNARVIIRAISSIPKYCNITGIEFAHGALITNKGKIKHPDDSNPHDFIGYDQFIQILKQLKINLE